MINIKEISTAFDSLAKAKGYVVTIVLTLGVTLGALVAMFNLSYQLLATPLPYADEERLMIVTGNRLKNGQVDVANMYSYQAHIEAYKSGEKYFDQKALVYFYRDIIRNLPDTPQVNTGYITPEYFQLVQAPMALGRAFNLDEGLDSNSPVIIISYATWAQLFNKNPSALGKTLRLGSVDFKIIGVTAAEFVEPQLMTIGRKTQVWIPWDFTPLTSQYRQSWGYVYPDMYVVGKLRVDMQPMQVEHELTTRLDSLFKERTAHWPFFNGMNLELKLVSYRQAILGDSKGRVLLLLAGTLALLLIAAANIINLILARAANQQKNMAIRAALGAQKSHLFNTVLVEILLIMTIATILSILISFGGIELLKHVADRQLPRLVELSLSWQSIIFALFNAAFLGLVFAFLVSRQIDYRALNSMLQSSGKGVGIQISAKVRNLLILTQVALTGVLLAASLQILQQSLHRIHQQVGFTTDNIYHVILNSGEQRNQPPEERKRNLLAIRNELLSHPNIDDASLASDLPISVAASYSYISPDVEFKQQQQALSVQVDERYVDILGLKWVAGRNFTADGFQEGALEVIVNETLARKFQPDADVLNQYFHWISSPNVQKPYTVVGIVRDFNLPGRAEEPRMFFPQASVDNSVFVLKLKPGQELTKIELNELMARVNSQYKISSMQSMAQLHEQLVAQDTLWAGITAALVLLAISLAVIGIYGVLSYSVQLRRYELGIRMAIGARPVTVFMQILKDNIIPVIVGLAVALITLAGLWLWVQQSSYHLQTNISGWVMPIVLVMALTAATTLLSVWQIISKPPINALHNS